MGQNKYLDTAFITVTSFDKVWTTRTNKPGDATNLDELAISYQMNGMNYLFNFKADKALLGK